MVARRRGQHTTRLALKPCWLGTLWGCETPRGLASLGLWLLEAASGTRRPQIHGNPKIDVLLSLRVLRLTLPLTHTLTLIIPHTLTLTVPLTPPLNLLARRTPAAARTRKGRDTQKRMQHAAR